MSYLIGVVLAIIIIVGGRAMSLDRDGAFYPLLLGLMTTYYVVFAAIDGTTAAITFELVAGIPFMVVMMLGLRRNVWWIVPGLAAHALVDTLHATLVTDTGVPAWWPAFCAAFDVAAAAMIALLLHRRERRMRAHVRKLLPASAVAVLAVMAIARDATAQASAPDSSCARPSIAVAAVAMQPVGALHQQLGGGVGVAGSFMLPLDRQGVWSVRVDAVFAEYGAEEKRIRLSEPAGDRIKVELKTVNAIVPASIGVQLTAPAGTIRPYVTVGVGAEFFYTESRIQPAFGGSSIASSVNQSDAAAAWTLGGGVYVPVRVASRRAFIDVGAQYYGGGVAEYLDRGGITDRPDGSIAFLPMRSSTHVLLMRIGARLSLQ